MKKLAIIGGGLTGLSAAYYIGQALPDWQIDLYEKSDHFGGKMQTKHIDGYNVEMGPDSYLARKPAMGQLLHQLGMDDQIVKNGTDQAYIYDQDRLYPIPGGSIVGIPTKFIPFARTRLLSWPAKFRAIADYFKHPYPTTGDISIGKFFQYHLGNEMVTKIIEPLMSGIYGGNLYQLSLDSTFPQFHQIERRRGNMVRGMMAAGKNKPHRKAGIFRQLKGGLSSVTAALVHSMPSNVTLHQSQNVSGIEFGTDQQYHLIVNGQSVVAKRLVITTPPRAYNGWFKNDPAFDPIRQMKQSTCAIVMMSFDRAKFDAQLKGTGFVITRTTDTPLTACTIVSNKWRATSPRNRVILRVFLGKPGDQTVQTHSEEELGQIGLAGIRHILHFKAAPLWIETKKLPESMPQYTVGHRERVDQLKDHVGKKYPGLSLIGMPYDGIGMPDCIRQAKEVVDQLGQIQSAKA